MLFLYIFIAILLLSVIFVFAPAVVCYRSVFGRRKVLPLDDERLHKPSVELYKERMLSDLRYLKEAGYERVSITAKDGVTLCADHYDRGADKTAVMVHGYNADPYVNLVSPARWLYDSGFNLLVIYQRAHSYSGGKQSGMGLLEQDDVLSWIGYLENNDPSQRILLYGASMGGTTLAYLSDRMTDEHVKCMMIDSAYVSIQHQLRHDAKRMHLPFGVLIPLIRLLCRHDMHIDINEQTVGHLKNAKKPILFFHTTNDPTVDLSEGQANFEACTSGKQMVIVDSDGHTTAFLAGEEQVTKAMSNYIEQYIK
ncbi:MAG: alpha/beta hydrolase [Ruminococcus sp.]|nr:alpha/beta hydrolase [Ruminococcus sp.]